MNEPLNLHLAALRAALKLDSAAVDQETQVRVESWAKRGEWAARSEALPLLVGAEPAAWGPALESPSNARHETVLWQALAASLRLAPETNPPISPTRLRNAAEALGLDLPLALARVLDFITAVLPPTPDAQPDSAPSLQAAEDKVTVLGAAVALIARTPDRCVNEAGYYDAARIAQAIFQQAVYWFPLGPPSLDEAAAATLIARWLPVLPAGVDPA